MYWYKAKTILIIVFLAINVFLLTTMIISVNNSVTVSNETIENTIEILSENNIIVDCEIPTRMYNLPIIEMENLERDKSIFAAKILGEDYNINNNDDYYEFESSKGKLTIKDSKFVYINNTNSKTIIEDLNNQTVERYAKRELEGFGLDTSYLVLKEIDIKDDIFRITFNQSYDGKNIYDTSIILLINRNGIIEITGYWMVPGNRKSSIDGFPHHVTSILIDFIRNQDVPKDKEIIITDIILAYHVTPMDDIKEIQAIPVWIIVTGDKNEYYYDARNGEYIVEDLWFAE